MQWFLSESGWDAREANKRRLELLSDDACSAPNGRGVLVIDEHGDRKWGRRTAHVGRQWLANIGKTDNGVVSVSTLWADEGVYWPHDFEPYTPAHHFAGGRNDPEFRTKLKIARELVKRAVVEDGVPFRAVVADSFYGEDEELRWTLRELGVGYVFALKPSHCWWHREGEEIGALWEAALYAGWEGQDSPGKWVKIERRFSDGHIEEWWALEVDAGPYGPERAQRAVVATTDPEKLPERKTWYLVANLCPIPTPSARERAIYYPRPTSRRWCVSRGLGCGWNRATSRSSTSCWAGATTRSEAPRPSAAIGSWCGVLSRSAGGPTDACRPRSRTMRRTILPPDRREGKKRRPRMSWPRALRSARGWLEPWIMLRRYWRAFSGAPPPPELRALLELVFSGRGLYLYVR
jgi:hypothetical protein